MDYFLLLLDWLLHLDRYLAVLVQEHGAWIYVVLFAIVFSETGFVVTPFLPGDSLLFVAGALAALGGMELPYLLGVLLSAAILGNMLNYQIGRFCGERVFQWKKSRFFSPEALHKTHEFYARHGGKTLVVSRFLPIFRTFAPFVAGVGAMPYRRFTFFNLLGALCWVLSLTLAGYWFGNQTWIRQNLTAVILFIILLSFLPLLLGYCRHRLAQRKAV
ncbi:MAG: DedA family protein [Pseudomonadota bacterium]